MAIDGTYLQGITTVVHDWTQINFNNFVYSAVYFTGIADGGGGGSSIINGNSVTIVVGVTLPLVIKEEGTILDNNFVLLGNPMPVFAENFSGIISPTTYQSKYSMNIEGPGTATQIICGNDTSVQILGDITLSMWAFPESEDPPPGEDGYLIERYISGDGYALFQNRSGGFPSDSVWSFKIGDGGAKTLDGSTLIDDNNWFHVVGVLESGVEMRLYINGILDTTLALAAPMVPAAAAQDLRIGGQSTNAGEFLGDLNNGAIWNAALTDEEVLEVFNGGIPMDLNLHAPQRGDLISWWKLGDDASWDGTDWHIPDQIGGNNGTSLNLEWGARKITAPIII
jgi:hypothetical protein